MEAAIAQIPASGFALSAEAAFIEVEGHRAAASSRAAGGLCFGLCLALVAYGIYVMFTSK